MNFSSMFELPWKNIALCEPRTNGEILPAFFFNLREALTMAGKEVVWKRGRKCLVYTERRQEVQLILLAQLGEPISHTVENPV